MIPLGIHQRLPNMTWLTPNTAKMCACLPSLREHADLPLLSMLLLVGSREYLRAKSVDHLICENVEDVKTSVDVAMPNHAVTRR